MNLSVLILCGGKATRLHPVTRYLSKSLYPICGKPFIDFQLELLKNAGFNHVVLAVGHLADQIVEHVGDGSQYGLQVDYSMDGWRSLGTAGAVKKAMDRFKKPFLITYGDSYLPVNYTQIVDTYLKGSFMGLVTVYRNTNTERHKNNIYWLKEKNVLVYNKTDSFGLCKYMDYGISIFHPVILSQVKKYRFQDMADVYNDWGRKGRLSVCPIDQPYYEIGSPVGVREFTRYVIQKGL